MGFNDFLGNLPVVGDLFGGGDAGKMRAAMARSMLLSNAAAERGMRFYDQGEQARGLSRDWLQSYLAAGPQELPNLAGLRNMSNPFAANYSVPSLFTGPTANRQNPGVGGGGRPTPGTPNGPSAGGGGGFQPLPIPAPAAGAPTSRRPRVGGSGPGGFF